jgi:endonuclease YncB( thermonuclease family)
MAAASAKSKKPTVTKHPAKPTARTKPAKPAAKAAAAPAAASLKPRAQVTHRLFGPGVVLAVDGDKLEIKFKTVGTKWIIDSYVSRA